jgi:hypothetical protein
MRVGWIGLGRMGLPMATRLLDGGNSLSIWNRTKSKAEPLGKRGANIVNELADLAGVDVLFTMVATGDDVKEVAGAAAPVGTGNGCLHGALVMCVRGDLFDTSILAQPAMARDYADPGAGLAQMAHDTTANKASSAKHGDAAHSAIRQMIPWDAID